MNPEKPVYLLHAYGNIDTRNPERMPTRYDRLAALTAMELYRQGEISKVVIAADQVNKNEPVLATAIANHMKIIMPKISQDLIVNPVANNTRKETKLLKKAAKRKGWDNLWVGGMETHLRRIKRAKRRFLPINTAVISVQEILTREKSIGKELSSEGIDEYSRKSLFTPRPHRAIDTHYKKIIDKQRASKEEKAFKKKETIRNVVDSIPLLGGVSLDVLADCLRSRKYFQVQRLLLHFSNKLRDTGKKFKYQIKLLSFPKR